MISVKPYKGSTEQIRTDIPKKVLVNAGVLMGGGSLIGADFEYTGFEYGHYLQSQSMGWAYLSRVAIPSAISASASDGNHRYRPFEQDANRRAFEYFNEKTKGFYQTEGEYLSNKNAGIQKGWDFEKNPLDVYHTGKSSRGKYYDYKNPKHRALVNKLALGVKWYDYVAWIGGSSGVLAAGYGNGNSMAAGVLKK